MSELDELWELYFQYLIWRGHLESLKIIEYSELFECLHSIPFIYRINRDENREEDGRNLRDGYNIPDCYNRGLKSAFLSRGASVFEVLLSLAIRVDDEYIGSPNDPHPEDFFMEMIRNMRLDRCIGKGYNNNLIRQTVLKWMDRDFSVDGFGSPFPVKHDHRDQRKLEIWDQMNSYIYENYF